LPVVLYNVPSRTGCDMLPATVGRLAHHGGIVGLKEARSDAERISAVIALQNPQFSILSGDDATCMDAMLAGADGVISVAANVVPEAFRALCDAARAGDAETARRVDGSLAALYEILGVEPNPIPLKWCLHRLGFGEPDLRAPLLPLSPPYRERADRVVASLPGMIQVRHSDAA
jgi:4-hydroxy-tetrahydrodipicolinate synthase